MIWIGTSGYNYPEWKGSFYPEDLPETKMLPYYAERFPTVEINYTFYRFPSEKQLAAWTEATPARFRLTVKASRRITHEARLKETGASVRSFCERVSLLGEKLGVVLFQLPPNLKKNLDLLDSFLETFPRGVRAAFEFRSDSWHDDAVYERLRARSLALCIADSEKLSTPIVPTAEYGYLRLRDEGYEEADIDRWAEVIRAQSWAETFVYFKHEEHGKGPEFARLLMDRLGLT
jgi:uncharacterized protein YecE (DUF72 family)